jgi:adenosylhomocysteinase
MDMSYKITGNKLRVSEEIASEKRNTLATGRFVLLQHLLEDTYEFTQHLQKNLATIDLILGKQYSADPQVINKLKKDKVKVTKITYQDIEKNTFLLDCLVAALKKAQENKQRLVVHEVGGYFARVLTQVPKELLPHFAGVVEDTTYGYNKYLEVEKTLPVPVFHVSRSELKEVEARYVGTSIVSAFDALLREVGVSITGREALVVGYGMIGKNVARTLRKNNIHTTVYDIDSIRTLHAFIKGHTITTDKNNLGIYDVIVSSTGTHAINEADFDKMKDGVVLISGGSKDIEFDLPALKKHSTSVEEVHEDITLYHYKGKKVYVLRHGTALNFRQQSVPSEIIDLVYSEILSCMVELLDPQQSYAPGIYQLGKDKLAWIAQKWLRKLG